MMNHDLNKPSLEDGPFAVAARRARSVTGPLSLPEDGMIRFLPEESKTDVMWIPVEEVNPRSHTLEALVRMTPEQKMWAKIRLNSEYRPLGRTVIPAFVNGQAAQITISARLYHKLIQLSLEQYEAVWYKKVWYWMYKQAFKFKIWMRKK